MKKTIVKNNEFLRKMGLYYRLRYRGDVNEMEKYVLEPIRKAVAHLTEQNPTLEVLSEKELEQCKEGQKKIYDYIKLLQQ